MIEELGESKPQINLENNTSIRRFRKQRIQTFDLARGFAIFFMIIQHVVLIYGNLDVNSSIIGLVLLSLGTMPAAPVFLFLMGVCYKYSEKDDNELFQYGLKRGLKLIFSGYCLNLCRFSIPLLIGLDKLELNLYEVDKSIQLTPLSSFFIVDILQCAGLSLIIMAFIVKFFKKEIDFLLISAVVLLISPFVWGRMTTIVLVDFCLNLLWGTGSDVFFPIFPWLVYPLVGMAFGQRLRSGMEIGRLISISRNIGIVLFLTSIIIALRNMGKGIFVIGTIISLIDPLFRFNGYEHPGPVAIILIIGFILVWMWICYLLIKKIPQNPLYGILFYSSENVTVIYIIQWMIIGWGIFLFGYQTQNLLITLFLICFVIILTDLLAYFYSRLKAFKIISRQ